MTAQVTDGILYAGDQYAIAGILGDGLFEPSRYGIEPLAISTACARGYFCDYAVDRGQLQLKEVHIGLSPFSWQRADSGAGPLLFNATPRYDARERCYLYASLNELVDFTGNLLLGRDFIPELYVHMGFHPAWKYREVHELGFEHGRLIAAVDRSAAVEQFRATVRATDLEPGVDASCAAVRQWIDSTFSRAYEPF